MKSKILIVEDSATQAAQLQFSLEEADFAVEVAEDAERAIEMLREIDVDLVVSDIMLPGASGFDLCQEIKSLRPNLPVVMLSTLKNPHSIIMALETGADYFLTKPYEPEHLITRIRTALSTSDLRSSTNHSEDVRVVFQGQTLSISSSREQILGLLLSTFEDIYRTNRELENRETELASAKFQLERHTTHLENLVAERTQEILKRQKQLSDAQSLAQMGDWVLDVPSWQFIRSDALCALLERKSHRKDVRQALKSLHPDDQETVEKIFIDAVGSRKTFNFEARFIRSSGEERNIWVLGHPRTGPSGEVIELFGILQDITDRKRMELHVLETEEQLYKAQKMEAIGQLTGGMSHDFNNLLSVIMGNLDLAREEVSSPFVLECIDEAIEASQRGAELNQRLLAFARRQSLQAEPTDINEIVTTTSKLLTRVLGRSIDLQLCLHENPPPALIDSVQLESAVLNLAINARDAMPEGGRIELRTVTETLTEGMAGAGNDLCAGQYVVLEVIDTGSGMSPDVVERACDPFFTTKEVGKGSGLGLSMVAGFLQQSGGALQIDTKVGEGTRMRLFMPVAEGADQKPAIAEGAAPAVNNRGIILAVEDNEQLRSMLVKQLRSLGYDPIEADSGDAALEIIRGPKPIDILLTDVVMPGSLDGIQLVEEARKIRSGLKVIVSSGFPDSMIGKEFKGMSFLKKPYKKSELAITLAQVG